MKKLAALIVLAIALITLSGCGGASTTSSSTTDTAANASATPDGQAPAPAPEPEKTLPQKLEITKTTPDFFAEALKKNQPLLVMFYGDDEISQDVIKEVKVVQDMSTYKDSALFMLIKMDENDEYYKLANELQVSYVPYIAVINRRQEMIFEKNGYVVGKVLEQALYNASFK